jgi:arginyl-tRNA synthetase
MSIVSQVKPLVVKALKELYGFDIPEKDITVNTTKSEFEGDYTVVLFALIKSLKKPAEQIGEDLGNHLVKQASVLFQSYNVIKDF